MCKNMIRAGLTAMVTLVASMVPLASHAQSVDDWKWQATVYGWFPSISGKTSFPPSGGGPSLDIDAEDIIDSIKFVFMGSIEAQRGKWGVWTDLIYLDLEADKSGTRDATIGRQALPVGVDLNANLEIKGWVWTLAGTYSVIATPEHSMQLLAGARLLDLEEKLGWQFNGTACPRCLCSHQHLCVRPSLCVWCHLVCTTSASSRPSLCLHTCMRAAWSQCWLLTRRHGWLPR
jgi:hypothetical protein